MDTLLVVCSDIDATFLDHTGVLKQLIAGDTIRAEYKNGKDFNFVPVCKLLFSANKLPRSADKSHGWYSRLQFVEFKHQFTPDPKYYDKIMTAMKSDEGRSVLLNWAVEGLIRIEQNGNWTISESMIESKNAYKRDNDNVQAFADAMLEPSPIREGNYKTSLVAKAVYNTYKEWCDDNGMKAVALQEFNTRLCAIYAKRSIRWKMPKGDWKSQTSFIDVQFREDCDLASSYNLNLSLCC